MYAIFPKDRLGIGQRWRTSRSKMCAIFARLSQKACRHHITISSVKMKPIGFFAFIRT